jgi:uncharacterized cupredoxin-like copper-binding protein
MKLRYLVVAAVVLAVAACSGGGSSPSSSVAASAPSAASAGSAANRIEVALSDSLRMDPAEMTVKAGQPVTFVVTNTGAIQHEFFVGDEAAQGEHEQEMMSAGGMTMDEPDGIVLKPGETKELTHLFSQAGTYMAGCHENGHYAGGMKASVTVTE